MQSDKCKHCRSRIDIQRQLGSTELGKAATYIY